MKIDFKREEDYSLTNGGNFYQISEDTYVSALYDNKTITWHNSKKTISTQLEFSLVLGVIDNSLIFTPKGKRRINNKAELINDEIVTSYLFEFDYGVHVEYSLFNLHYFIIKRDQPELIFSYPFDVDFHSTTGLPFMVPVDDLHYIRRYIIKKEMLFMFICDKANGKMDVRRYMTNSTEYDVIVDLPEVSEAEILRLSAYQNKIYYISKSSKIVSIDIYDLSFSSMTTNLPFGCQIIGVTESGKITVQTDPNLDSVSLFTGRIKI